MEDGVEVILNHIEPYTFKGKHSSLQLEKQIAIDAERNDLVNIGLTEIHSFDVDSDGNIYILCFQNDDNLIFKFDKNGNFIQAFGRKGQGPGEFEISFYFRVNANDELLITANQKILIYDTSGAFLKEIKIVLGTSAGTVLDNGLYLFEETPRQLDNKSGKTISHLSLYDSNFVKIKDLDRIEYLDPGSQEINATYYKLLWQVNDKRIYTMSDDRGYEILVYDLNGNLLKKIRKKYNKSPLSSSYKEGYKNDLGPRMYELLKSRLRFPSSSPPFHYFLVDEKNRLFVRTWEQSELPNYYFHDIFSPEGIFILRKNMRTCVREPFLNFSGVNVVYGAMKNGRFYCLGEKDSGYRKLVVYKMIWDQKD